MRGAEEVIELALVERGGFVRLTDDRIYAVTAGQTKPRRRLEDQIMPQEFTHECHQRESGPFRRVVESGDGVTLPVFGYPFNQLLQGFLGPQVFNLAGTGGIVTSAAVFEHDFADFSLAVLV